MPATKHCQFTTVHPPRLYVEMHEWLRLGFGQCPIMRIFDSSYIIYTAVPLLLSEKSRHGRKPKFGLGNKVPSDGRFNPDETTLSQHTAAK